MNLQEIADSIEIQRSINSIYKEKSKKSPWLMELLEQAYMEVGKKIKLTSSKYGYITYDHACDVIDNITLTVAAIYETKIRQLEGENAS